jgi:hypothetical protein
MATATALAPTATQAEVAAKVALLRGYPAALRAVERAWGRPGALRWVEPDDLQSPASPMDENVALLLTFGDGAVVASQNMRQYLATWATQGAGVPPRITWSAAQAAQAEPHQGEG